MSRSQGPVEELIRSRVAGHPNRTWLKWKATEIPWHEVLSNIQRAANGLLELGVNPGERVAILMPNCPEYFWVHFAIGFIGALSLPVNISQRGITLEHILADSDASCAIVHHDLADLFAAARERCPSLRRAVIHGGPARPGFDWTFDRLMTAPDREPAIDLAEPAGGIAMLYTSGTTGPPKGVVPLGVDFESLNTMLNSLEVKPGETLYTPLPLFHGNALVLSGLGSMLLDAQLALSERFSASRFWSDCRRYEAVEFNSLGGMLSILLKQPPTKDDRDHQVRVTLSAACPPDRWKEFEERFGVLIIEGYGMVDSPGFLLNAGGKVGSMGKPIGGVEFAVVDEHDRPLPPGEVGELIFRHPKGQMTYYHKLPEATAASYRGGWFHSGDLATVDADGFYYFKGRMKESMRRLGENISAWEIETVVNQHPGVLESGAHGVPSALGEEDVKVVVVSKEPSLTAEKLLDFCRNRLPYYAIPRYVEFVDELPKTGTQRIQYAALKERGITPQTWDREASGYLVERR